MSLISIKSLVEQAEAKGFRVRVSPNYHYAELFSPQHSGPDVVLNFGDQYSTADIILSDRPSFGYGYNGFFHGPWHDGLCQTTDFSVKKLLAYFNKN